MARSRPLSPHLQIYRLPFLALMSILHRATGVFLTLGGLILVYWLVAIANGPDSFLYVQQLLGSFPGQMLLFASTFALFYHLGNGIRHLFWDSGFGFELRTAHTSGLLVIAAALILTLLTWSLGYALH